MARAMEWRALSTSSPHPVPASEYQLALNQIKVRVRARGQTLRIPGGQAGRISWELKNAEAAALARARAAPHSEA